MLKATAPIYPGFVTPNPRMVFPPAITRATPGYAEAGVPLILEGAALSQPPWAVPVVKVNGMVAAVQPNSTGGVLYAAIPAGATPGPITIETAGGVDTLRTPYIWMTGPSTITQLVPASGRGGDKITVYGTNLARSGGICTMVGGQWFYIQRVGGMLSVTSNTQWWRTGQQPAGGAGGDGGGVADVAGESGGAAVRVNPAAVQFQHMP